MDLDVFYIEGGVESTEMIKKKQRKIYKIDLQ